VNARLTKIGDLIVPVRNWNPLVESKDGTFSYVDLSAVDNEAKKIRSVQEIRFKDAPSRARQLIKSGDILVSTVRPNLNGVAKVSDDLDGATASTGFCVLRADPNLIFPEYLFQWVKNPTFVSDMVRKATGASYPAISDRIIAESFIPLPSLDEQRRIATILDHADELRGKRGEAIDALDRLATATFVEAFEKPEVQFQVARLEELVSDIKIGLVRSSEQFGKLFPYPYVRMDAIGRDGDFDSSKVLNTTASAEELLDYRLEPGDFLLNTRNSKDLVGKTTVFPGGNDTLFNNNIMRIRFRPGVRVEYISAAFQRPLIQAELEMKKSGTTSVFAIYWRELKSLRLPVPPERLQVAFASQMAVFQNLKKGHRRHLQKLNELFSSLQHRAFKGNL
jgi:type I restriction enzyme S subunit